jgi:oligosaccharyltransferase complex subunit gamma
MKLFTLIPSVLYLFSVAFAASPNVDKFERYQSISRLAPLQLDDSSYDDLIAKPRDYYAAVILTAMEARFGCTLCRDFQPEFDLIARSWNKGNKPDDLKLLFGTLDFTNGKNTFQKVCIGATREKPRLITEHSSCFKLHPYFLFSLQQSGRTQRLMTAH